MLDYDVGSLLQTRHTGSIHWNPLPNCNCPGVIKNQAADTGRLKKGSITSLGSAKMEGWIEE